MLAGTENQVFEEALDDVQSIVESSIPKKICATLDAASVLGLGHTGFDASHVMKSWQRHDRPSISNSCEKSRKEQQHPPWRPRTFLQHSMRYVVFMGPFLNLTDRMRTQTTEDVEKLLAAQCHLGAKNLQVHMEPYLWKTRPDGINVINIGKTVRVEQEWAS